MFVSTLIAGGRRCGCSGVDPGLTRCGIGVVDGGPGRPPRLVEVVVVRTPPGTDLAERLLAIAEQVEAMMDRLRPDTVAIERMFSQHNVRTVMGTAQASGVVALAAARRGIPVAWHTPSEVKAAVSGNGNADKAQVTAMVTRLLRLPKRPSRRTPPTRWRWRICHLWRSPMQAPAAAAAAKATADRASQPIGTPDDQLGPRRGAGRRTSTTPSSRSAGSAWPSAPPRPPWPACAAASRRGCRPRLVVREDSLTLFGFATDEAKELFELVQSVSGVGPEDRAGAAGGARPGRPAPRAGRRRHRGADPGARDRQARAPSGWCWSSRTRSGRSPAHRPAPAGRRRHRPAAGGTSWSEALVGLGLHRQAGRRRGRPRWPPTPRIRRWPTVTSACCCAGRSRLLGRNR